MTPAYTANLLTQWATEAKTTEAREALEKVKKVPE